MNGITAKKALLELCLGLEDEFGRVASKERRNEERLKEDTDWTGVVIERVFNDERRDQLLAMGFEVHPTEKDYHWWCEHKRQFPFAKVR